MRISVLAPTYLPAHKSGGPVPGILGVVETLDGHDVHVLTPDRDLGDTSPFPAPYRGTTVVRGVPVSYLPPFGPRSLAAWLSALVTVRRSDLVYANSLMSRGFTVLPLLLLWATRYRGRVVISPRGELAASALRLGGARQKRAWLRLLQVLRLDHRLGDQPVVWVASTQHEADDVRLALPRATVVVVPERLRPTDLATQAPDRDGSGPLRVVSVGRLAPVKGHDRLLRGLAAVHHPVSVEVLGLAEDPSHVAELESLTRALPAHVTVTFAGALPPDEVERALGQADLFVLLTHGENFGHAIGEALRAGCPVLISDRTAWSDVAGTGAGVVLEPALCDDPSAVAEAIDAFATLDDTAWQQWSTNAQGHVRSLRPPPTLLEALGRVDGTATDASHDPAEDGAPG